MTRKILVISISLLLLNGCSSMIGNVALGAAAVFATALAVDANKSTPIDYRAEGYEHPADYAAAHSPPPGTVTRLDAGVNYNSDGSVSFPEAEQHIARTQANIDNLTQQNLSGGSRYSPPNVTTVSPEVSADFDRHIEEQKREIILNEHSESNNRARLNALLDEHSNSDSSSSRRLIDTTQQPCAFNTVMVSEKVCVPTMTGKVGVVCTMEKIPHTVKVPGSCPDTELHHNEPSTSMAK